MNVVSKFVTLPSAIWIIDSNNIDRVAKLQKTTSFERIVQGLIKHTEFVSIKRERFRSNRAYSRCVITFSTNAHCLDLFHNSSSGYRAQYFHSTKKGELANKFTIDAFKSKIEYYLNNHKKRGLTVDWCKISLSSGEAKIWIHQGRWLYHAKRTDRILKPVRWQNELLKTTNPKNKKKIHWGSLTPASESRFVVKGGFYNINGEKLVIQPKNRALEIHSFGFT